MADNHVFIPMQLDAMVLNQEASIATPFNRFQTEYGNLQTFTDPEQPFPSASTTQPPAGIYLHWTMPKALRQGTYNDDGTTTFPYAPNRWLVVRVRAGAAAPEAVKAWVLESDFLDDTQGTSPFIDPHQLNQYGTPNLKTVGRATRLGAASPASQPNPFLKAVGPGSATFASYSPNVENVFAFTDPLTESDDKTPIPKGTFTYYVAGWYSDPVIDPLTGTSWQARKDDAGNAIAYAFENSCLDWYVLADSADGIPTGTLVHALVHSIVWDSGADNPKPDNYPTDIQDTVKVAVGNTAVDALSAMVRLYATADQPQAGVQADLLEAFQYGLLSEFDQPGSAEALNMEIRRHWYGASSGGTLWQIAAKEREGDTALPAPPAPDITPQEAALLATLNTQQAELDRQQRILESMQWNLYAFWWRYNWLQQNTLPVYDPNCTISDWFNQQLWAQLGNGVSCNAHGGTDPSKEAWYFCKVQAQLNLVAALTQTAKATQGSLQTLVDAQSTQVLRGVNMPQYFYPNDPALLVTGLGRATNFDPQGDLLCRLPAQLVNTLAVGGTTYTAGGPAGVNIQPKIPPLEDPNGVLPAALQQLHVEGFFLSPPVFAEDILNDAAQAPAVAAAIAALPQPAAGGEFPPLAFAAEAWAQPWVPLLLDWQVAVLQEPAYTSTPNQRTCTFNQGNWQFDGTDFKWAGTTTASGLNFNEGTTQMVLQGRTFVTPYLSFTLADKLDEFVQKHKLRDPNLEKLLEDLDQYLDGIRNEDFLSQRLGGLMAKMVQRNHVQTVVPTGAVAALLGDRIRDVPMPYPDEISLARGPAWDFGPAGGTFFVIQKLTVTDSFGRAVDLMLANNSADPQTQGSVEENYFYPITSWNMQSPTGLQPPQPRASTDATQRMVRLPPRIVQDTQLSFRLASNDGKMSDLDQVAGANPVCGWVVPNHLDRSLALYAPDGTAWGELYLSLHVEGHYVPVWQPDPTNPQAPQTVACIPNQYVSQMLQTLVARADNGLGFSDFLQVIDETLWTINPRGRRTDQNLSVLVGRPLAVVRAQASLKLRGLPYVSQDWWNTFDVDLSASGNNLPPSDQPANLRAVDGGIFEGLQWPVRLGSQALRQDGLVGYYLDDPAAPGDTYKVFNTVTLPSALKADDYLKQIGADDNYLQLACIDDTVTAPDPSKNQVCGLTMLVDPRAGVHAFTGLLPVVRLDVPAQYVTPALRTMYYTFRAGPFLTTPDAVRIPRPAESRGVWTWFDNVLKQTVPVTQADQNVSISLTPPLVKEGWLKFTPDPPQKKNGGE